MASEGKDGLSQYLLHLIASDLPQPVIRPSDENWREIQTHYIGNNSLFREITKRCYKGLINLKPEKMEKVLANGPPFLVTSSFPIKEINGQFKVVDIIPATVEVRNADQSCPESYVFKIGDKLCLRICEPRSPMTTEYCNEGATATIQYGSLKVSPL